MNFEIFTLSDLLSRYGEEAVAKKLETFVPAFKSANDPFLTKMSIVMEKKSECRTYIAFDRETSKIMGFFSICFRCLEVSVTVDYPRPCSRSSTGPRMISLRRIC